ncbi:hypothetical protein KCU83_g614, partial [Aureobasidium melanogenum]
MSLFQSCLTVCKTLQEVQKECKDNATEWKPGGGSLFIHIGSLTVKAGPVIQKKYLEDLEKQILRNGDSKETCHIALQFTNEPAKLIRLGIPRWQPHKNNSRSLLFFAP